MKITETIETGIDYYWKRSEGWQWFDGRERWWEYFVEFSGLNGAGGVWCIEKSRWNGTAEFQFRQPRTLSVDDSRKLVRQVRANQLWAERRAKRASAHSSDSALSAEKPT